MLWHSCMQKLNGQIPAMSLRQEDMYIEGNPLQAHNSQYSRRVQQPLRCANCDIEILWPPTVVQGKTYCCSGCAVGGPCNCDYSQYRSVNIAGRIHYDVEEGKANAYPSLRSIDRPRQL